MNSSGDTRPPLTDDPAILDSVRGRTIDIQVREFEYASTSLGTVQHYTCFAPADSDRGDRQYPLVILLHGLTGNWRDWGTHTRLANHLAGNEIVVVCPDGGNGWYTNGVGLGERREDDILYDLLPALDSRLALLPTPGRAIAGLSMGGYGAIKIALKYPKLFSVAVSHSGALDITSRIGWHPVFGDAERDAAFRRGENPLWLAEQALSRPIVERPTLMLDCGASDPLVHANRAFSDHLNFIGYGHTYVEPGVSNGSSTGPRSAAKKQMHKIEQLKGRAVAGV